MESAELTTTMLARVRRHMIISFAGIALAITGVILFGAAGHGLPVLFIASIPVIGLTSTFRNLRCPACNGLVAMQTSANSSPFARTASKQCRHCGKTIFDDRLFQRSLRLGIVVFAGTLLLGGIGALLSMLSAPH